MEPAERVYVYLRDRLLSGVIACPVVLGATPEAAGPWKTGIAPGELVFTADQVFFSVGYLAVSIQGGTVKKFHSGGGGQVLAESVTSVYVGIHVPRSFSDPGSKTAEYTSLLETLFLNLTDSLVDTEPHIHFVTDSAWSWSAGGVTPDFTVDRVRIPIGWWARRVSAT